MITFIKIKTWLSLKLGLKNKAKCLCQCHFNKQRHASGWNLCFL